jgi:transcriptional regulator with XRE-family HTH domain
MEDRSITERVAAKVRGVMGEARISQTALAERLGIPQQRLSRRLSGDVSMTLDEVYAIAGALGVEPSAFLPVEDAA